MIYESDVSNLLSKWNERLQKTDSLQYKDALYDCLYDLKTLSEKSFNEEIDYQEMLEESYADNYLSSMEAHEQLLLY